MSKMFRDPEQTLKEYFKIPQSQELKEAELEDYYKFVIPVMMGSGFEVKGVVDFAGFQDTFNPDWATEYHKWVESDREIYLRYSKSVGKRYFRFKEAIIMGKKSRLIEYL